MTGRRALRVAVGILIGVALGALPFLRYAGRPHHHAPTMQAAQHQEHSNPQPQP